ncbi:MAG: NUDIX hydrolase [Proteobacteria bacterium]|jgi:8-oxo-dGTP pyrophosphatase MutT (NUDIX family)|nr:NUDIX hydrolase [Pseudomonadota bacterium]
MKFLEWAEQRQQQPIAAQPVISYDFDGVLHTDVYPGTIHPVDFDTADLTPNLPMHRQLRDDARKAKIIVVTARNQDGIMDDAARQFVRKHNLPVSAFFFTNGGQKVSILKQQHAIKHYDDDPRMRAQLMDTGIEFVLVRPQMESTIYESVKKRKKTKPAAGIFFTDGRAVLMLKRRPPGSNPNTWGLPGGHSEGEETPLMAAQREAREECGKMTGKKFGVLTSGAWTCFFYQVPKTFRCEISEEHDAWEWVKFEELKHLQLHPQFKKQMQRYIAFVKRHFA